MFLEYLLYYVSDTASSISQYAHKVGFMISVLQMRKLRAQVNNFPNAHI